MDYDTWVLIEEGMKDEMEREDAEEEICLTCKAAPCRCDAIYDAWREEGVYT